MYYPTRNQIATIAELGNGSRMLTLAKRTGQPVQLIQRTVYTGVTRLLEQASANNDAPLQKLRDIPPVDDYVEEDFYVSVCEVAVRLGYLVRETNSVGWSEYVVSPKMNIPGGRRKILVLIAKGLPFREIAKELDISPETVKTQSINIRKDLEASNLPHAVAIAFTTGLITKEDVA
jgi:DNA-binding CsgD family transcriptional regulator